MQGEEFLQSFFADISGEKSDSLGNIYAELKKRVEEQHAGVRLESYGSFVSGTQNQRSDLDVTLITEGEFLENERGYLEQVYLYLTQSDLKKSFSFEKILHQQVKVPLLSLENKKNGKVIEITMNNVMGLINSKLL
jgi:DNA polymerase sigma